MQTSPSAHMPLAGRSCAITASDTLYIASTSPTTSRLLTHKFDPGGLVPAQGLQMSQAERVFQEAGTYPIHIARSGASDPAFYRQLIAYIESGFPLFAAMHGRRHAIAVIGYDFSLVQEVTGTVNSAWDLTKALVVFDDKIRPYLMVGAGTGSEYTPDDIDSFLVPLPEKIFYPAEAVELVGPDD